MGINKQEFGFLECSVAPAEGKRNIFIKYYYEAEPIKFQLKKIFKKVVLFVLVVLLIYKQNYLVLLV